MANRTSNRASQWPTGHRTEKNRLEAVPFGSLPVSRLVSLPVRQIGPPSINSSLSASFYQRLSNRAKLKMSVNESFEMRRNWFSSSRTECVCSGMNWRNPIWTEKEMQSGVLLITVTIYNWVEIDKNTHILDYAADEQCSLNILLGSC